MSYVQWQGKPWCCRGYSPAMTEIELQAAKEGLALLCQGEPATNEKTVKYLNDHGVDAVVVEGSCPGDGSDEEA